MTNRYRIGIAGCGPAGLAAALLLHRQGHEVSLFERFETPQAVGSGLMLQPTGLGVLQAMGLAKPIAEKGSRIDRLFGRQESGRIALDSPYERISPNAFGLGIHRASLFHVLFDAVNDASVPIQTCKEVSGSIGELAGRRLSFADGTTSRPFDLIVDALGWRTRLADDCGSILDFGALWATLPIDEKSPFMPNMLEQRYFRASQMIGVLPIGRRAPGGPREVALFWSLKNADYDDWRRRGLDLWKADVRALWPAADYLLSRIDDPEQLTFAQYAHRTANAGWDRRLFHIGDSWHSASPQLGQGANMALLDAWSLAKGLEHGRNLQEAQRLAIGWRADHVHWYQAITALFTPMYQSDSTLLPMVRDSLLLPMSRYWPGRGLQANLMSGLFGSPLGQLGLQPPDYDTLARHAL